MQRDVIAAKIRNKGTREKERNKHKLKPLLKDNVITEKIHDLLGFVKDTKLIDET